MNQNNLKPEGYKPRLYDAVLARALKTFGAVEVAGPMWCGKTWTSLAHGKSVSRLARASVRRIAENDPTVVLEGQKPHIIDEWQDVPAVWDAVREAVDESGGKPGSFILTGSSSLRKEVVGHSGAGRITRIRMNTMTLQEMGLSTGKVSLSALFEGSFQPQFVQQRLAPLASIVCQGGWPALQDRPGESVSAYLDSYFDAIFEINFPKRGLSANMARSVAKSLARNAGSAAKLETIARDVYEESVTDSMKNTVSRYIDAFERFYLLDIIPGWDAPIKSKSRVRTKPKRYFADPSMSASLLGVNAERLLEEGQLFGLLFEAQCIHDLKVYASLLPNVAHQPLYYYRDSDGLEVDAIIELRDGTWAAFEVKLGESGVDKAVSTLTRLHKKIAANPAARNKEPAFMAVITGAGELARYDKDKNIYIIPLTSLGA